MSSIDYSAIVLHGTCYAMSGTQHRVLLLAIDIGAPFVSAAYEIHVRYE